MEHRLKVGESALIKKNIFASHTVFYAGMPNEDTYSLAVTFQAGHMYGGYNLFLPLGRREVFHKKGKITVLAVSPDEVRLKIER